jgi:hypothetical protein
LAAIAFSSTLYDYASEHEDRRNSLLLVFSFRQNLKSLINLNDSGPGTIQCFHGIRVLMTLTLIFFHSYFFRIVTPFKDDELINEWKKTTWASAISTLNCCVDSFFVMSAVLTTRSMLKDIEK